MKIQEVLNYLDINEISKIRNGFSSIHKIKEDDNLEKFTSNYDEMHDVVYTMYSNDNTNKDVFFLDKNGKILNKVERVYSHSLVYSSLGFELDYYSYAKDNSSILKEYANFSMPEFGK